MIGKKSSQLPDLIINYIVSRYNNFYAEQKSRFRHPRKVKAFFGFHKPSVTTANGKIHHHNLDNKGFLACTK
jgi:hypothetical protein